MFWIKKISSIGALLALALLFVACGGSTGTSTATTSPTSTMPGHSNMAPAQLVINGQYSDQRFIDMMVPHHMMAVQMAQVALQKAEHTEIKQLATSIISSQQQEIQALKNLKKHLYGTSDTPTMMNAMDWIWPTR